MASTLANTASPVYWGERRHAQISLRVRNPPDTGSYENSIGQQLEIGREHHPTLGGVGKRCTVGAEVCELEQQTITLAELRT